MTSALSSKISIAVIFIWTGAVLAISFLEAWLKFRAPGVTLPIGLSIGRIVFGALNKIEWVLCLTIIAIAILQGAKVFTFSFSIIAFITMILLLQTFLLLPQLDVRAELHITGQRVPSSNLHFYFITAEVIKVVLLISFGITQLRIIKI